MNKLPDLVTQRNSHVTWQINKALKSVIIVVILNSHAHVQHEVNNSVPSWACIKNV